MDRDQKQWHETGSNSLNLKAHFNLTLTRPTTPLGRGAAATLEGTKGRPAGQDGTAVTTTKGRAIRQK